MNRLVIQRLLGSSIYWDHKQPPRLAPGIGEQNLDYLMPHRLHLYRHQHYHSKQNRLQRPHLQQSHQIHLQLRLPTLRVRRPCMGQGHFLHPLGLTWLGQRLQVPSLGQARFSAAHPLQGQPVALICRLLRHL